MNIKARTADHPYLSNVVRNKKAVILDCRGDEDTGYEYLIEVGKFTTLRLWLSEEYMVL